MDISRRLSERIKGILRKDFLPHSLNAGLHPTSRSRPGERRPSIAGYGCGNEEMGIGFHNDAEKRSKSFSAKERKTMGCAGFGAAFCTGYAKRFI